MAQLNTTIPADLAAVVKSLLHYSQDPAHWNRAALTDQEQQIVPDQQTLDRLESWANERAPLAFDFTDHGIDHEQYFPGAGTANTEWEECYTGIGDNAHEAAEDALDNAATDGWNVGLIQNPWDVTEDRAICADCEYLRDADDEDDSDPEECADCDRHYYVTLYLQ